MHAWSKGGLCVSARSHECCGNRVKLFPFSYGAIMYREFERDSRGGLESRSSVPAMGCSARQPRAGPQGRGGHSKHPGNRPRMAAVNPPSFASPVAVHLCYCTPLLLLDTE